MKDLRVRFFETNCCNCGEPYYISYIVPEENNNITFDTNVMNQALEFSYSKNIKILPMDKKYRHTKEEKYMSFGCPKCYALLGDHYLKDLIFENIYDDKDDITI